MVDSDEDLIHKSQVVVFHQEQPVQKQPALCYSDVSANHPQGQGISFDISLSAPTKRPGTFWHQLSASRCERLVPPTVLRWHRPLIRNEPLWGTSWSHRPSTMSLSRPRYSCAYSFGFGCCFGGTIFGIQPSLGHY
jgi:hypothetical protein